MRVNSSFCWDASYILLTRYSHQRGINATESACLAHLINTRHQKGPVIAELQDLFDAFFREKVSIGQIIAVEKAGSSGNRNAVGEFGLIQDHQVFNGI